MVKAQTMQSYREILKNEFEQRNLKNARYSLRSFARDLGLSPSRLSEVLNGRYGLSRKASEDIADKLSFSKTEKERFCDLVDLSHARSKTKKELARLRLKKNILKYKTMELDAFRVISDWHHLAILELTYLDHFKNDSTLIGKTLGISPSVVESAIDRLKKVGLIKEKAGNLVATEDFSAIGDDKPSLAVKNFHKQIMERALSALFVQSFEERDFSSVVMAISKSKLPQAKDLIRKFKKEFSTLVTDTTSKDSVYCLGIQFFDLAKGNDRYEV
jgi:uncharacterized protein (TIGR02147 family)